MRGIFCAALLVCGCSLVVSPAVDAGSGGGGSATGGGSSTGGGSATGGGGGSSTGGGSATGGGGGSSTGGGSATGGGGASTGGGSASGGGTGTDGGMLQPCTGSSAPRLSCTAMNVYDGGAPDIGLVAANGNGWLVLAGRSLGHTMQLLQVDASLHLTSLATIQPTAGPYVPAVGGEGTHWAIAWASGSTTMQTSFQCQTDSAAAQTVMVPNGLDSTYPDLSIDIDSAGDVGAAAVPYAGTLGWAIADGGCPASLDQHGASTFVTEGNSVMHVPGRGDDGFRFGSTSFGDPMNFIDGITLDLPDGGSVFEGTTDDMGYESSALSTDASLVLMAYVDVPSGGPSVLTFAATPADGSADWSSLVTGPTDYSTWQVDGIGANRFAFAWVPNTMGASGYLAKAQALTVVGNAISTGPAYDVACDLPAPQPMGMARFGASIGVLVPSAAGLDFYVCTPP